LTVQPKFNQPVGTFGTQLIPFVSKQGSKATAEQVAYLNRLLVKAARTTWATQNYLLDK